MLPSDYSSSTGCACMSNDQLDYINSRGGNVLVVYFKLHI